MEEVEDQKKEDMEWAPVGVEGRCRAAIGVNKVKNPKSESAKSE